MRLLVLPMVATTYLRLYLSHLSRLSDLLWAFVVGIIQILIGLLLIVTILGHSSVHSYVIWICSWIAGTLSVPCHIWLVWMRYRALNAPWHALHWISPDASILPSTLHNFGTLHNLPIEALHVLLLGMKVDFILSDELLLSLDGLGLVHVVHLNQNLNFKYL